MKKIKIQYMVLIVSLVVAFSILLCGYGEWEDKLQADIKITVVNKVSESDKNTSIKNVSCQGNLSGQPTQKNEDY